MKAIWPSISLLMQDFLLHTLRSYFLPCGPINLSCPTSRVWLWHPVPKSYTYFGNLIQAIYQFHQGQCRHIVYNYLIIIMDRGTHPKKSCHLTWSCFLWQGFKSVIIVVCDIHYLANISSLGEMDHSWNMYKFIDFQVLSN